jgi:5-(carboxyamino)imidazole ribonucleotide synthase
MTVGIVGAGQLGRMLALAGYPLGIDCLFLDRDASTPGGQVGPILTGEFTDRALLRKLARSSEVVTFDWENISVDSLQAACGKTRIAPPPAALATGQDRLAEKRLFEKLGIPTNAFAPISSRAELDRALKKIGLPAVLKTRRLGYDGKGQALLKSAADIESAWDLLGKQELLCEQFVPFDFEVSIVGARSTRGEIAVYPLNRNLHLDGILRLTRAPANAPLLAMSAEKHLRRMLQHFDYAGILTIEFFVRGGRLVANEIAPRVHNSGHWTIEGAVTSQFENHLRAILGLPLGSTAARAHCAMINLIGELPRREAFLDQPDLHWHDYGKTPRPGRKVGHITLLAASQAQRDRLAKRVLRRVAGRRIAI